MWKEHSVFQADSSDQSPNLLTIFWAAEFRVQSSPARYYHLTHDYLVPSLREWLTRKERATIGGRARIRLAERTAEWTARRSRRYLPTFWEWVVILLFTRRSRRSSAERRLVTAATGYHATRAAFMTLAVALGCLLAVDRLGAVRRARRYASWKMPKPAKSPRSSAILPPIAAGRTHCSGRPYLRPTPKRGSPEHGWHFCRWTRRRPRGCTARSWMATPICFWTSAKPCTITATGPLWRVCAAIWCEASANLSIVAYARA